MTTPPSTVDAHTGPYIPKTTRDLLAPVRVEQRHPGLQLDKFSAGGSQKDHQGQAVQDVCKTTGDHETLEWAIQRRAPLLTDATTVTARTEGPFTLHLSRASALENAGICLHPLYGFAYLPGSGLKGMARAWAETNGASQKEIHAVFGRVPEGKADSKGAAGAVVFHDAWPTEWPTLIPDIVNNHHRDYYEDKAGKVPPGDWMGPVLVQFLAVAPGTPFLFAVGPRSEGTDPALVTKAVEWLTHALALRGAGAKTNAGYGTFVPVDAPRPTPDPNLSFTVTLELTSPAFLAGATQDGKDCDLRPATLRGLLRWWWRTLHAGHMTVSELKQREALIWGDTTRGGAVRVTVRPEGPKTSPSPFDKDLIRNRERLSSPGKGHIQGLFYASYGMDETVTDRATRAKTRRQRFWLPAGTRWSVTLISRDTGKDGNPGTALDEAKAALWLLSRYGGAGSKARKGFGSFADIEDETANRLVEAAKVRKPSVKEPPTPALEQMIAGEWIVRGSPWQAIDAAWHEVEQFASARKHSRDKVALGLPRQIHGPLEKGPLKHQNPATWQRPEHLRGPKGDRHAAPYHLHVGRRLDGTPVLRFTAFPAPNLPDSDTSRAMLEAVRDALDAEFGGDVSSGPAGRPRHGGGGGGPRYPRKGEVDGDPVLVLRDNGDTYCVEFPWGDVEDVAKDDVMLI
ncbi:type III-B CRISPR module RAMP protein Cmr6 [Roseospira visakhapatnamensis]|uniref:CRISPR-associated protein Cmr6 n=1 Tax=Roseospira visakhapatnamensis TaxID=390880 RepID=A0A7W6RDV7_9PROT|nr:type III-B CRISPR module RAMP protein Cmr6 [Roseospira visakhapatnamensis]MBB4266678.1 CRISPR-associated protein Cmr6 [Roseospira visakhapatnamensis]